MMGQKISLFHNKSSLYKLNYRINDTNIWIKRDDTLDFGFGGNKVRLYEYIANEIVSRNAEKLITYGSIHSNHIRVSAAVAEYLNIECDLIVLHDENWFDKSLLGGNGKLIEYYNANIIPCKSSEAHEFIDDYLDEQKKNSINYFWVPGGGYMPCAIYGYADAAKEILEQALENKVAFDAIFLPTGTGTTQAGLLYGLNGAAIDIFGVTVARTAQRCIEEIKNLLCSLPSDDVKQESYRINVIDNMLTSYGETDEKIINTASILARIDGVFLDPIYNAKAFVGMCNYVNQKDEEYNNILYINTGGSPNLFSMG